MIQTLSDALSERGYETLTPVQEAVTTPELEAADLLVSAQTGSGKTVGFGLAIAPTILDTAGMVGPAAAPLALMIAPTRELAFQVSRELGWLYARSGARVVSCVGGMDMREERRALERGAHIVVGTPGRLRDHIQRGSLEMDSLRAVVLDEADEMLDLGFREDLEFMLSAAPADRRTLMFSATVPPAIAKLAQQYQREAVRVTTRASGSQHADIAYQALRVAQQDAETAIINVLRFHDAQNAIVFANTRALVNRLTARFANRGFAVVALSGELSQTERTHALQAMRDGRARVCVATDVAARGIDLPNLDLVIHAELPSNGESLLHRSGRTGRAGRKGVSALIVPPKVVKKAERLLKFAKIQAEWTLAPSAEEILRRDEERLLSDPAWDEETSPEQAAFAARLLDLHTPEVIAAAYLRLYRSRQSAPEELDAPDAARPAREREPFGPSVWIALSVGRNDRAEARWLLPLLCRAGNLDKAAIGAIRVQQDETFVELTAASLPGFLSALGADGQLEQGVKARQLETAPDLGAGRAPPANRRSEPRADTPPPRRESRPAQTGDAADTMRETPPADTRRSQATGSNVAGAPETDPAGSVNSPAGAPSEGTPPANAMQDDGQDTRDKDRRDASDPGDAPGSGPSDDAPGATPSASASAARAEPAVSTGPQGAVPAPRRDDKGGPGGRRDADASPRRKWDDKGGPSGKRDAEGAPRRKWDDKGPAGRRDAEGAPRRKWDDKGPAGTRDAEGAPRRKWDDKEAAGGAKRGPQGGPGGPRGDRPGFDRKGPSSAGPGKPRFGAGGKPGRGYADDDPAGRPGGKPRTAHGSGAGKGHGPARGPGQGGPARFGPGKAGPRDGAAGKGGSAGAGAPSGGASKYRPGAADSSQRAVKPGKPGKPGGGGKGGGRGPSGPPRQGGGQTLKRRNP